MKNLKKKLEEFLRNYEVELKYLEVENLTSNLPTAIDIELVQAFLERKDLERYKSHLTEEQKQRLKKADEKAIRVYNQIKDLDLPSPPTIVARQALKEIVDVIEGNVAMKR